MLDPDGDSAEVVPDAPAGCCPPSREGPRRGPVPLKVMTVVPARAHRASSTGAPEAIAPSLSARVGRTPLVRLARLGAGCGAEIVGKLEVYNPAGSVKDRIGVAMIEAAEREGRIEPGRTTIVEAR